MILGFSTATFTFLHVLVSLVAIGSGLIVILGLIAGSRLPRWTALFLITTALTSLSGFLFPFTGITPGIVLGVLSLIVLLLAVIGLYGAHLSGAWRGTYIVTSTLALYFNFFVLVVQAFRKVPALRALAPTQSELPFKVTQFIVLLAFIGMSTLALLRFRGEPRGRQESWQRSPTNSD
jgi:hypothetical protein